MSRVSSPPPVTTSDFYSSLTAIWLFLTLISLSALPADPTWRSYLLPVGTLLMLGFYARAWRGAQVLSSSSPDSVKRAV